MIVQVHTDNHVEGSDNLTTHVTAVLEDAMERFRDRLTRIEVFFADENSNDKGGDDDKRCKIEARLGGLKPVSVSHHAGNLDHAFDGAVEKLETTLSRILDRLGDHKGRTSYAGDQSHIEDLSP